MNALIVFVKLPRPGEVKTRLGASIGMAQAAEAYEVLARHVLDLVARAESAALSPLIFYSPGPAEAEVRSWIRHPFPLIPQEGEDLGSRMLSAFCYAFDLGAERTVIVGTDIPELDEATLQKAYCVLDDHDLVVGPSPDGGYYLLGMKAPVKNLFDGIAWSTPSVREATLERASRLGLTVALLQELSDIDTAQAWEEWMRRKGGRVE